MDIKNRYTLSLIIYDTDKRRNGVAAERLADASVRQGQACDGFAMTACVS